MSVRINYTGPKTDAQANAEIRDHLYDKLMAPPPQAAEPMGNSIRRLLNATRGGSEGGKHLPMHTFLGQQPAVSPRPMGWKGPDLPSWGTPGELTGPQAGQESAWTEQLPTYQPRPLTAREAQDRYEAWKIQQKHRLHMEQAGNPTIRMPVHLLGR